VVAGFDGGRNDVGGRTLPLGAADRAIRLIERFAACFADDRAADLIERKRGVSPTLRGARTIG
jgi:hypothetical protein